MRWKILQITDTHLFETPDRELGGVNTCQTLGAVVADIASHHPVFDALLLTGDLSQDEKRATYALLKRLLEPIGNGAPVHVIPGNHDDLRHMQASLDDGDPYFLNRDLDLGAWRVVMLNSQVPGRVHGELGAEQIGRLRAVLDEANGHVIAALHHPPVEIDCAWLDGTRCVDGDQLLDAAAPSSALKAVVCGHVHQQFETTHQGVAILTTPSTCVQFKPGCDDFAIDDAAPGYRVFHLEDDGRWSSTVRRVRI